MKCKMLLLCLVVLFSGFLLKAETSQSPGVRYEVKDPGLWTQPANLTLPAPVARPFFGELTTKASETLYIIGGSNFDRSPAEGGVKQYSNQIFSLTAVKTARHQLEWQVKTHSETYPVKAAEGLGLVTSKGLLCIGGANENGELSSVYLMNVSDSGLITFSLLPDLPVKAKMMCGGVIDKTVYVYAKNTLFFMHIPGKVLTGKKVVTDWAWGELEGIPGSPVREQAVSAIQTTDMKKMALFVMGGFNAESPVKPALTDAWQCTPDPEKGKANWVRRADIDPKGDTIIVSTVGAAAVPSGAQSVLVIGGFNLEKWNNSNQAMSTLIGTDLEAYKKEYFTAAPETFGWNKDLIAYQTVPDAWTWVKTPIPLPTCGSAVGILYDQLVIAGGEIKPGLRTNAIQITNLKPERDFGTLNWIIFLGYLAAMLPFGFFFMRRGGNTKDYFKGGGKIPWWVSGVSIFAAMLSSITFMSIPAMSYISDWRYFPLAIAIFILAPVVIHLYLPFFRRLNITSAYEYLEKRFNTFSRVFASAAFVIFMVARSAIVIFLPSLALSAVAGIDLQLCIVLVGAVTIIYSTCGGMSAVVWADFVHSIVLGGGAILALVLLIIGTDGGAVGFFETAYQAEKLHLLDLSFNFAEPVIWITIIGGLSSNLASYTSDQTIVQRYLTTKDEKAAGRSIWFNGSLSLVSATVFYLIGTGLYTFYKSNPGTFDIAMHSNDAIFPTFIVTQIPPGLSGLLIAAIFAATMSTLAANFNSASTAFVTDFYRRFIEDNEKKAFTMAHYATVAVGVLSIAFALVIGSWENIYSLFDEFQKMIGILTGGLAGLFLMGIFIPRINGVGAVAGLVASYAVNLYLIYGDITHRPHLLIYAAAGLISCVIVGYIVSLFTGKPPESKTFGLTLATIKSLKTEEVQKAEADEAERLSAENSKG